MAGALEITIDIIIHATEVSSKFLDVFEESFGVPREKFSAVQSTGYYDNIITIQSAKLQKNSAHTFLEVLFKRLSKSQKDMISEEFEKRLSGSKFHLRLGKQEFVTGTLAFKENDAIRLKIHTPIYNKKDASKIFKELFQLD